MAKDLVKVLLLVLLVQLLLSQVQFIHSRKK